jgi:acyl-CoA reductase-like NAD-dependent aldehyde dehydrogenase
MKMFIDGDWVDAASGETDPVTDPMTSDVFDTVPRAGVVDAGTAIEAAQRAFKAWSIRTMTDRVAVLKACATAMRDNADLLGRALHRELGRPLPGCIAEINSSASLLDIYTEEGLRLHGEMPIATGAGEKTLITREPVGVVVAITPFNFPITLLTFKLGAALTAGCTIVAKPSEDTPTSTLLLAEIFHKAGLPKGAFNVVTGSGTEVGEALVNHPIPRKIAFTGGAVAGKAIAAAAAGTVKRFTLELGGHCPAIVCADADLDKATTAITRHGTANSGQFCYRVNRIYVERPVYDEFLEKLTSKVSALTLAPAGGTGNLGPMVNEKIFTNSVRQTEDAISKGARILCGGAREMGPGFEAGFYFPPTILADVTDDMLVLQHETFGPILGVCAVNSASEALERANNSEYGLAGFVFCRDLAKGIMLCEGIEAGLVWLNDIQRSSHYAPFGGVKQSGMGREKGRWGVEAYLEYKTIYLSYEVPV